MSSILFLSKQFNFPNIIYWITHCVGLVVVSMAPICLLFLGPLGVYSLTNWAHNFVWGWEHMWLWIHFLSLFHRGLHKFQCLWGYCHWQARDCGAPQCGVGLWWWEYFLRHWVLCFRDLPTKGGLAGLMFVFWSLHGWGGWGRDHMSRWHFWARLQRPAQARVCLPGHLDNLSLLFFKLLILDHLPSGMH